MDGSERIVVIKHRVLYGIPDLLGTILCLGKSVVIISNGLGKKILGVSNYECQEFITQVGGSATGRSPSLTADCNNQFF